jgi:AhpC/TSA family
MLCGGAGGNEKHITSRLPLLPCVPPQSTVRCALPNDRFASDTACVREETFMHPDLVIGKHFPDLVLPDHRKQPVRLSELARGFPLILSFYRGYW